MKFRVAAVQYDLHAIQSFQEFADQVIHYTKTAGEFGADFLLFPEFFTTQLLSIGDGSGRALKIYELPKFTQEYLALFTTLAKEMKMHIIGGTHLIENGGKLYNTAHLFYPDGSIKTQSKLHMTPTEVKDWHITPGEGLQVFDTEKGKIAILTCYDIEFPEIVRIAKARGADVIFCPSCTDDRHGFYRVRYTSHARAVENQICSDDRNCRGTAYSGLHAGQLYSGGYYCAQ